MSKNKQRTILTIGSFISYGLSLLIAFVLQKLQVGCVISASSIWLVSTIGSVITNRIINKE